MDFRSLNNFNVMVNAASGNFLPITGDNEGLSLLSTTYLIFVWFIEITYVATTLIGLLCYLPLMEAIECGGMGIAICLEVFCLAAYLIYRRENLRSFVREINSILVDSDDLKRCISESVGPDTRRMKVYTAINMSTWLLWEVKAFENLMYKSEFTYTDFKLATYFPGGPLFTVTTYCLGTIFRSVAGSYIMLKKIGIDVYMNYYITLLTAQYQYLKERIASSLNEVDDVAAIDGLKECVVYHCNTNKTGKILVDILSFIIGVIYFNCIFRFCCTAFMIISQTPVSACLTAVFSFGALMQVYLLCSSIQNLLEASTAIGNEGFYVNWFEHGRSVRSIFYTIKFGSLMECRLSAFRLFDLTVPTVATILKQSYSACLLLMRMQ